MVGLCAGCNDLNPGGAFGIGALSGITLWWVSEAVKMAGIDDPLDAFAVHYGGGICGVLLTPVFADSGLVGMENCDDQQQRFIDLRKAANLDIADISGRDRIF
jgi:Amt family ammonium transporter